MNSNGAPWHDLGFINKCDDADTVITANRLDKIAPTIAQNESCNSGESSDELFSEEEEKKDLFRYSHDVSKLTNASLDLSDLSPLHINRTPGAKIPSTPLSLVPFLTKINEQWSSDLETPQADKATHYCPNSARRLMDSAEKQTSERQIPISSKRNEYSSTSPVINNKMIRRGPKRRIFKTAISSETVDCNHEENKLHQTDSCTVFNNENPLFEADMACDFFSNASFEALDEICSDNFNRHDKACNKDTVKEEIGETYRVNKFREEDINTFSVNAEKDTNLATNTFFSTANGKPVKASEKALCKAQMSFANELEDNVISKNIFSGPSIGTNSVKSSTANISNLFSTASGKSINISEKALSNARTIFANELEDNTKCDQFKDTKGIARIEKDRISLPFTSTSSKCVSSTNQLLKTKEIVKTKPEEKVKKDMSSCLFATASGKPMVVSETALSKAKALYESELARDETIRSINPSDYSCNSKKGKILCASNVKGVAEQDSALRDCILDVRTDGNSNEKENVRCTSPMTVDNTSKDKSNTFSRRSSCTSEYPSHTEKAIDIPKNRNLRRSFPESFRKRRLEESISDPLFEQRDDTSNLKKARIKDEEKNVETAEECIIETKFGNELGNDKAESSNSLDDRVCCPSSPVIGRQVTLRKRGKKKSKNTKTDTNNDKKNNTVREETISSCNKNNDTLNVNSTPCNNLERMISDTDSKKDFPVSGVSSAEFGDSQLLMDYIVKSDDILQKRMIAVAEQERIIEEKKARKEKRITGRLFSYKIANQYARVSWRELTRGAFPKLRTSKELISSGISSTVLDISATNAEAYRFRCIDYYGQREVEDNVNGLEMENGAYLILDENGCVGIPEIKRSFLTSSGVDPNLIPAGWIENHYRWIVWKLASMDRVKFETVDLPRTLTPANVMAQMRYRYDREIDRSQRPALRQILEKDAAASRRMILCVSSIMEYGTSGETTSYRTSGSWKISLTDGWYEVPASIDLPMIDYIAKGKVREGTKLVTCGAELLNCDRGCSPLEIPGDVVLKIHTNSTRRARWDAKLGYTHRPGPIPIKLESVSADGGLISEITVIVSRVYPILYHEKIIDGEILKSIFRNARSEEKASIAYEQSRNSKMETFYADAIKEFVAQRDRRSSEWDVVGTLADECESDLEQLSEQEFISNQQRERLLNEYRVQEEEFKKALQSKLSQNLPPPRRVTAVLKIRVAEGEKSAILTIWSPSDETIDLLREGHRVTIRNVHASGKRNGELQFTANRGTTFDRATGGGTTYPRRIYTPLCDTVEASFDPTYSEFDTVGFVVSVTDGPYNNFEAVNLMYPNESDPVSFSYLSILFWQGVANYGYEDVLTVGSLVACDNLEWRRVVLGNLFVAYCTERTLFTRNPRRECTRKALEELEKKKSSMDLAAILRKCAEDVATELQKRTPSRPTGHERSMTSDPERSEDGIRSSAIRKRLDRLKRYGEPPPLSPILIRTDSKRISLDFRSPIRRTDTSTSGSPAPI